MGQKKCSVALSILDPMTGGIYYLPPPTSSTVPVT